MPGDRENPRHLAYWFALSQIGIEMAAPIGLGAFIDLWLGILPWSTIAGAVIGLVGGIYHLVAMARDEPKEDGPEESEP